MASPDTILQRLEALKLWQEAEQQKLIEQQIQQRNLLVSEQQRMYEVLGLSFSTENSSIRNSRTECDTSECTNALDDSNCSSENKGSVSDSMEGVSVLDASDDSESSATYTTGPLLMRKDSQSDLSHNAEPHINPSLTQNEMSDNSKSAKPKRPFLKRGTGLVKYRMNLQDCSLKNIPKYKFAKTKAEDSSKNPKAPLLRSKSKACKPKRSSSPVDFNLKKPEVMLNCNKLPTIGITTSKLVINTNEEKPIELKNRMNKIADNAKLNCNFLPTVETAQLNVDSNAKRKQNIEPKGRNNNKSDHLCSLNNKTKNSQTWANVLDNDNIIEKNLNDSVLNPESNPQQDMLELKVFELLEQKANNSSFCSTSSIITKLMDNTPLKEQQNYEKFKIYPHPSEIKIVEDSSDNEWNDTKSTKASESDFERNRLRVRFADSVQIQSDSDTSENDLDSCDDISSLTSSCTSTPNIKGSKFVDNSQSYEDTTYENSTLKSEASEENHYDNERIRTKIDTNLGNNIANSSSKGIACTISDQMNLVKTDIEGKQQIIQQSTLLKQRLQELEKEIEVFRKENTALTQCKQEYELQKIAFQRHKRQIEVKLSTEKEEYDNYLTDEKKKLAEDRMIFEKYVTDLKKHPTRKEREEITTLKEKINELQQEIRSKEAKSGATSARLRTQIRNLETDITNRQKTIDELKEKNKKLLLANNQYRKTTNKKMLQEIQSNLAKVSNEIIDVRKHPEIYSCKENQSMNSNKKEKHSQYSYEEQEQNGYFSENNSEDECIEINSRNIIVMVDKETMTEQMVEAVENPNLPTKKSDFASFKKMHFAKDKHIEPVQKSTSYESDAISFMTNNDQTSNAFFVDSINTRNNHNLLNDFSNNAQVTNFEPMSMNANSFQKEREEILHPDGSKEIWYSNGNVKKISPDEQIIKMIYFNGDIKEIFKSTDTIKYFYAKNKMWHTTFSDGLEILEFLNGQTERRYKNGTAEVRFPDGSVRSTKSSDSNILDEWRYPDGSILINKKNGEKMLCMPNGQREIHTAEHRRREFPDGTVKLVYPDGSQETRYANGRIRTKDQSGNLVKDTHAA